MRATVALLVTFLALPAVADCIANGHFTIVANAEPLTGTLFPYTEDLTWQPHYEPVGDPVSVAWSPDLHWTKIQSGCSAFGERNISASAPVNLLLRASFTLSHPTTKTALTGTRYEVQFRLGRSSDDPDARVVLSEVRRLDGRYPQAQRFGATVQDLPAGNYNYSLWFRLLDGPETNRVQLGLQWINAQGVPHVFPSQRSVTAADAVVGTEWVAIGGELSFNARRAVDLALQSSAVVAEATDDEAGLRFAWDIDGERSGERFGGMAVPRFRPSSVSLFDHRALVPRGAHTLQLWAQATAGRVRLQRIAVEYVAFPARAQQPEIIPIQESFRDDTVAVTTRGDDLQPLSMSPICGRWTKVLEFETDPSTGGYSWSIEGFVEFLAAEKSGYGQIGVQVVREEADPAEPGRLRTVHTDVGLHEVQVLPRGDGVYFFGDLSSWSNAGGSQVSLWVRRVEGCNATPFGGGFTIGRRWVAVKLLPSEGFHLP